MPNSLRMSLAGVLPSCTALATKRETLYNEFWELREHGKDVRAAVSGTVRVFDPTYARELALAGLGIAYVLEPLVRIDLIGGQLVELLPEAAIIEPGLFLYFPRRAAEARKLRALLDVVREVGRQSATPLSEGAG